MPQRQPPFDAQAEACVLGAMILDPRAIVQARGVLAEVDFYRPAHQAIYRALVALADALSPVDLVTLRASLISAGQFERVGGEPYLDELVNVPDPANTPHYCRLVKRVATLRASMQAGATLYNAACAADADPDSLLATTGTALYGLQRALRGREYAAESLSEAGQQAIRELDDAATNGRPPGWSTGQSRLDAVGLRLRSGHLLTLGADTSRGKTALALHWAYHVASNRGPVLYVSGEMSSADIGRRVIQQRAGVNLRDYEAGRGGAEYKDAVRRAADEFRGLPMQIVGRSLSLSEIAMFARQTAQQYGGLAVVVVDYLQIMRLPPARSLYERVTEFTRSLKDMATELGCCVIQCVQLNRQGTQEDAKPGKHSFRDSSEIEQASNEIVLLHQSDPPPEAHTIGGERGVEVLLAVVKHRDGPTTRFPVNGEATTEYTQRLVFIPFCTRFEEAP